MVQWLEMIAIKSDDQSWILGTHMMKGNKELPKVVL